MDEGHFMDRVHFDSMDRSHFEFYGSRSFYGSTSFSMDEGHFALLWTKVILLNARPDSPARSRSGYSLRLMVVNFC